MNGAVLRNLQLKRTRKGRPGVKGAGEAREIRSKEQLWLSCYSNTCAMRPPRAAPSATSSPRAAGAARACELTHSERFVQTNARTPGLRPARLPPPPRCGTTAMARCAFTPSADPLAPRTLASLSAIPFVCRDGGRVRVFLVARDAQRTVRARAARFDGPLPLSALASLHSLLCCRH